MKYFLDTEFIEGWHKPLFGKRRHFIDLISIGITCEDGREFYAISNEFNSKDASDWVKENVISKLPTTIFEGKNSHLSRVWKSNKQIAEEIKKFIYKGSECSANLEVWGKDIPIEFYGYYADYDWVLFCSLFGRMIDLPQGFPMYCRDLKQMFDDVVDMHYTRQFPQTKVTPIDVLETFKETAYILSRSDPVSKKEFALSIRANPRYPKQVNEHNALADAIWTKQLYEFLTTK